MRYFHDMWTLAPIKQEGHKKRFLFEVELPKKVNLYLQHLFLPKYATQMHLVWPRFSHGLFCWPQSPQPEWKCSFSPCFGRLVGGCWCWFVFFISYAWNLDWRSCPRNWWTVEESLPNLPLVIGNDVEYLRFGWTSTQGLYTSWCVNSSQMQWNHFNRVFCSEWCQQMKWLTKCCLPKASAIVH